MLTKILLKKPCIIPLLGIPNDKVKSNDLLNFSPHPQPPCHGKLHGKLPVIQVCGSAGHDNYFTHGRDNYSQLPHKLPWEIIK